jgi:hypothetical protein
LCGQPSLPRPVRNLTLDEAIAENHTLIAANPISGLD